MASMTRLELAQRLAVEAGIPSSITTSSNQTGEIARLFSWIDTAYIDIQEAHEDWGWLLQPMSFATVAQQPTYTPAECGITDFGMWKEKSFRSYVTATGTNSEIILAQQTYNDWRDAYQFGSFRTTYQRPLVYAVKPYDKSLCLGPTPDATGYTINGEYYKQPVDFSGDTDTPIFPSKFHMIIVWKALWDYGMFESAGEVIERAKAQYNRLMRSMESDQLPQMQTGEPIA